MIETIKAILSDKQDTPVIFKRNLVKEYLQILTLSFLFTHEMYRNLIFYGGSSLRHCYGLPRLSEDLDFVDIDGKTDIKQLFEDLKAFFRRKYSFLIDGRIQKFRCVLKFPILHELNLATSQESDLLYLEVEVYRKFVFCTEYKTEVIPVFKLGHSLLVKTFDLPTLMATKVNAVLHRKWEKTSKNGKVLARVKGRDYFDLMWYLEKGIQPNIACIREIGSTQELYDRLLKIAKTLDAQSIKYDLQGLIENQEYVSALKDNLKDVLVRLIKERKV